MSACMLEFQTDSESSAEQTKRGMDNTATFFQRLSSRFCPQRESTPQTKTKVWGAVSALYGEVRAWPVEDGWSSSVIWHGFMTNISFRVVSILKSNPKSLKTRLDGRIGVKRDCTSLLISGNSLSNMRSFLYQQQAELPFKIPSELFYFYYDTDHLESYIQDL